MADATRLAGAAELLDLPPATPHGVHTLSAERAARRFARLALAAAFLSAVAGRLGIWSGHTVAASFREFVNYTAQVNAFLPAAMAPAIAIVATVAEVSLAVALLIGFRTRGVAACAGGLLFCFGVAMTISLGPKEPLDYSVFSASAAAFLLAVTSRPVTR